jgi:RNase adaptor protein for sRNA GlmZ degradation
VINYLEQEASVGIFIQKTQSLVEDAINKYVERGFSNLSVAFGCTGGQHRSVYSAEQLFNWLKLNFDLNLRLIHREQNSEELYEQEHVQKGSEG